jgi:hypothetical protein
MTGIRPLERTLLDNLPWNRASFKFLARFLLALYDMLRKRPNRPQK